MVKQGSHWVSSGYEKVFVVISTAEIEGQQWVYYRDLKGDPPREYSCFLESFEQRFSPLPE